MLMIRVNIPLQISRGICVYGEIMQMHTIHESNHTVMKLPRNENSKEKKYQQKNNSVCRSYQAQLTGWMRLVIFTQTIHSYIDTRQRRTKEILNIFQTEPVFGLDDYQF